jgi:hypothetical protein
MIRIITLLFLASLALFAAGDATFEGKRELNVAARASEAKKSRVIILIIKTPLHLF